VYGRLPRHARIESLAARQGAAGRKGGRGASWRRGRRQGGPREQRHRRRDAAARGPAWRPCGRAGRCARRRRENPGRRAGRAAVEVSSVRGGAYPFSGRRTLMTRAMPIPVKPSTAPSTGAPPTRPILAPIKGRRRYTFL